MKNKSLKRKNISQAQIRYLAKKANWVRGMVLEMGVTAGAAHIAPAFSCVDILVAIYYGGFLRIDPKKPKLVDRDRFILSKGHASAALYVILADLGFFPTSYLDNFTKENGILGGHPEDSIPGIEASTGSLGHGLSIGGGLALAAKKDRRSYFTFVLMGDGECHEGSVWEAAIFAAHHELNNLVAIIDNNNLCATDFLTDCLDVAPLRAKWQSFGWDTVQLSGHSFRELIHVMRKLRNRPSRKPLVIIAKTVKGRGISFMENKPVWHYRIPKGLDLDIARREISQRCTMLSDKKKRVGHEKCFF